MDILTDYRITALTTSDSELARRAEHARIARERTPRRPSLRERLGIRGASAGHETAVAPCTPVTP